MDHIRITIDHIKSSNGRRIDYIMVDETLVATITLPEARVKILRPVDARYLVSILGMHFGHLRNELEEREELNCTDHSPQEQSVEVPEQAIDIIARREYSAVRERVVPLLVELRLSAIAYGEGGVGAAVRLSRAEAALDAALPISTID